jgi:sigma-E factor negative regulatory protein RseA
MDGDVETSELDIVCGGLNRPDTMTAWACYHMIGDALRGSETICAGFSDRFAERFAAEPTVLAPQRRAAPDVATWAWGAAATLAAVTVVGWTAMSLVGETPAAVAKAGEASAVRAARVRPSTVPADYLLAHQEYSPAATIQGGGPYMRAAVSQSGDRP